MNGANHGISLQADTQNEDESYQPGLCRRLMGILDAGWMRLILIRLIKLYLSCSDVRLRLLVWLSHAYQVFSLKLICHGQDSDNDT